MLNRSLISTAHWALLAMLLLGMLAAPVLAAPVPAAGPADVGVAGPASDSAIAGTNLDYTITVSNDGPNAADVSLADTLPAGTTFNSLDVGGGFTCTTPAVGAAGTPPCRPAHPPA